ncbi:MAG: hypothetical protein ABL964_00420 [Steroidobacteraceae bacterium]
MLIVERRWPALKWAGLMAVATLAACSLSGNEPEPGIYRAVIEAPEGEIPFGLELAAPVGSGAAVPTLFLLDGDQRRAFENVERVEKAIEARLPGGKATLNFTARRAKLSGYLRLANASGSIEDFAFTAEAGPTWRFFRESATDNADVAGRWSASINSKGGWVIVLTQSHDQVAGTFYGAGGVEYTVTGQVQGDDVRLSSFDGHIARLFTATVNDDGDLAGDAWSNITGSAHWTATRNPDAEIEAAEREETPTPL